ncbi:MAG: hypothetical protein K2F53_00650 [Rikenellaceae bacterium]|nr:hypothetical protein [Rikenellaceae bacterium]
MGAFIRKNIDGVGVILVFVPFLKKDDGVLLSAIESWAGIEADDAKEILKEYVSQIKNSLDTRGQYVIEGVGVLKYDANGVIYLAKPNEAAPVHQRVLEQEAGASQPEESAKTVSPRDKNRDELLGELAASVNEIVNRSEQGRVRTHEKKEPVEPRPEPKAPYREREPQGAFDNDYDPRNAGHGPVGASFYNPIVTPPPASQPQGQPQQQGQGAGQYPGAQMGYMPYGSGPQTPPPVGQQPIGRAQNRMQHRENLYGNRQPQPGKPGGQPQTGRPRPRPQQGGAQGGKTKSGNTVFYIAVIALLLAIGVVLYGFIFGNETPLDDQLLMEQVSDHTTNVPDAQ